MEKIEHVYFYLDGTHYCDFTLYLLSSRKTPPDGKYLAVDERLSVELDNASFATIKSIPAKASSSIYVTPRCPIALDTIRKNYTIKREPDAGDYNVFAKKSAHYFDWRYIGSSVLLMNQKIIFGSGDEKSSNQLLYEANQKGVVFVTEDDIRYVRFTKSLFLYEDPKSVYSRLLKGELSKPCITVEDLDLANGSPLTIDVLQLCYECSKRTVPTKDDIQNFVLQLCALEQYNWRKFTGSTSILMQLCINQPVGKYVYNHKSQYPKIVKNFMRRTNDITFTSKEDFELSRKFLDMILNIGEIRYSAVMDLLEKLHNSGIPFYVFRNVFSEIVRITPKKYEK